MPADLIDELEVVAEMTDWPLMRTRCLSTITELTELRKRATA